MTVLKIISHRVGAKNDCIQECLYLGCPIARNVLRGSNLCRNWLTKPPGQEQRAANRLRITLHPTPKHYTLWSIEC